MNSLSSFQFLELSGLRFASVEWKISNLEPELTPTGFDLIINIRQTTTKLIGSVNYKTDSIDDVTTTSMIERIYAVLKKITVEGLNVTVASLGMG